MTGGLVLCGTHNNQFVDAMVLSDLNRLWLPSFLERYTFSSQQWYFSSNIQSAKNKMLNFFLSLVNFIPTRRPQDEIFKGQGTIKSVKGNIIKGTGTNFLKVLGEKYTIYSGLPKKTLVVNKVIDDETAEIENPENLDLSDLNENFNIMPKLDQKEVFDNSWKLLKEGKVIGIFPEVILAANIGRFS